MVGKWRGNANQIHVGGRGGRGHLLATGAAVFPNIPMFREALLLPKRPDLRARDALVLAVVPFSDVLGDLDLCSTDVFTRLLLAVRLPREREAAAYAQKLESPLSPLSRGNIAREIGEVRR